MASADKVFAALKELGIKYEVLEHEAALNVEEQEKHIGGIDSVHTKNLFFKDKKHGMFLVQAEKDSDTNAKELPKLLGLTGKANFRFGSADALMEKLGVGQGSVSPLCVMHNTDNDVTLVLDKKIVDGKLVTQHPCDNTKSVTMTPDDLIKFCKHFGHEPKIVEFGGAKPKAAGGDKPKPKQPKKAAKAPAPKKKADEKGKSKLGVSGDKDENFSEWYTDVIVKSEMIEYYDISGCYILRPWSYSIWESIQKFFDAKIKAIGVENTYFPLFVSKKNLQAEADHVEGFAPEVAWVTKSGESDMQEPIAVRPTSETIMYPAFAKWIRSHRDLPLKINQWSNVVRWEFKYPTPFLRTREFLWQEGHTAFATRQEAYDEVLLILDFYAQVYEELLCVPVVKGHKTKKEKFAGGDMTTTVEGFIPQTGRGIQGATSHLLGQGFGKIYGIEYEDENKQKAIPWQNSWGITTRTIGVMVMIHGDNKGLVLPPAVSPVQCILVPIVMKKGTEGPLNDKCAEIEAFLRTRDVRVKTDKRSNYNPGWKFNHWEQKGVCLRLEVGPRDLAKGEVTMVRRDTGEKESVPLKILGEKIDYTLAQMQHDMLAKATAIRDSRITTVMEWKDFVPALMKGNMVLTPWCSDAQGGEEEEENVKDKSKEEALAAAGEEEEDERTATSCAAKTLCIPFDQPELPAGTKCFFTGKEAQQWVLWGRSY
jgi:prolyl-tRNA synthetase